MLEFPWFETVLVGNLSHGARHVRGSSALTSICMISKCEHFVFQILLYRWTSGSLCLLHVTWNDGLHQRGKSEKLCYAVVKCL